jgi:Ca2+:H+ antiporter
MYLPLGLLPVYCVWRRSACWFQYARSVTLECYDKLILLVQSTMETSTAHTTTKLNLLDLNRATSIVLAVVYLLYLWTQIASTKYAYKPLIQFDDPCEPEMDETVELGNSLLHQTTLPPTPKVPPSSPVSNLGSPVECDVSYVALKNSPSATRLGLLIVKTSAMVAPMKTSVWFTRVMPILLLVISTGLISVCGGYLVTSIDHFVDHTPISKTMIGLVILPLVGNAAELVSGIMFASRKQTDLAFAVAIGSAIQIALFVTPLVVLIGWGIGREMMLNFTGFEAATLVASSVLFLMLVFDHRCSILKGACLCAGYTIIV